MIDILKKDQVDKKLDLKNQIGFIKKMLTFVENIQVEIQEKILRIHLRLLSLKFGISLKEKMVKRKWILLKKSFVK